MRNRSIKLNFLVLFLGFISVFSLARLSATPVQAVSLSTTPVVEINSGLDQTKNTYDYKKANGFAWVPNWIWSWMESAATVAEHILER